MPNDTIEGAELAFEIAPYILVSKNIVIIACVANV